MISSMCKSLALAMTLSFASQQTSTWCCQAFSVHSMFGKAQHSLANLFFRPDDNLIFHPPPSSKEAAAETAIIFLPGCQMRPHQYRDVAGLVQEKTNQKVWVAIPKLPLNMANPWLLPSIVKRSLQQLRDQGYQGDAAFIGGHSLGGVFLPRVVNKERGLQEEQVLGFIHLGSFKARDTQEDSFLHKVPSLTMTGELDGMVRVSRIAEDYHRNVLQKAERAEPDEAAKIHHAVALVEGMNHFGFVHGPAPFIKQLRDLPQEISYSESVLQVALTIAAFVDVHSPQQEVVQEAKCHLLDRIDRTVKYLEPLIEALKLEGSKHMGCDPASGSVWACRMQEALMADCVAEAGLSLSASTNEFHASWYLDPFAEVPFYHPKVHLVDNTTLQLETMTDPIYEFADTLFDGGFFSNSVHELRCKFNSPQALLEAAGGKNIPFDLSINFARQLNEKALEYAMAKAPQRVRERYEQQGTTLVLGEDIPQSSGPGWIWNYLTYDKKKDHDHSCCREVRSYVMVTPTDHPIPSAGGKLYCKVMSPAKVLDWMYTDSLRVESSPLEILLGSLVAPVDGSTGMAQQTNFWAWARKDIRVH